MNSTNKVNNHVHSYSVWEICKFWILQTSCCFIVSWPLFERYVNFEFYKQFHMYNIIYTSFERYVNFEFYKPENHEGDSQPVWEICKFWILQTMVVGVQDDTMFERYVNFEFYKR